ncbi:ShlB/FhaC/HecB family hemolysin secretion/activation protein [Allonocardiopsis opalescens]|uniref:ShlB/FhaC/HecB family hemolysin secretion/activation protein n=1 Tax=Allonocardiopsis opalescens TaxID=1144618 RepID=UPI003CCBADF5
MTAMYSSSISYQYSPSRNMGVEPVSTGPSRTRRGYTDQTASGSEGRSSRVETRVIMESATTR